MAEAISVLHNSGEPQIPHEESKGLAHVLESALPELVKGYRSYMAKVNANPEGTTKGDPEGYPKGGTKGDPTERKEGIDGIEKNDISRMEKGLNEVEIMAIQNDLDRGGFVPDQSFSNTAKKYGYRKTLDAIRKAREEKSDSIKYICSLIAEKER